MTAPPRTIRPVLAHVKSKVVGWGLVAAYPYKKGGRFRVPLYEMTVAGRDDAGNAKSRAFEVIRFGVKQSNADDDPHVVGLKDQQSWTLRRVGYLGGSWRLYGNFLIHDGANQPQKVAWGQVGCIEVTGMKNKVDEWDAFESLVLSLSGASSAREVSRAGRFRVRIDPVQKRPPLRRVR